VDAFDVDVLIHDLILRSKLERWTIARLLDEGDSLPSSARAKFTTAIIQAIGDELARRNYARAGK
jgi:hypothetical protein